MTPLPGEGFLLCLAQIGLGLSGIAGIVLSLRRDPARPWTHSEFNGLRFILEQSFGLIGGSLLPFLIHYWLDDERVVWRISSGALAIFFISEVVIQAVRVRQGFRKGNPPSRFKLMIYLFFIPTIFFFVLELFNLFYGNAMVVYLLGLMMILFAASFQFWVSLGYYTKDHG
jgi:hypothetical protein